MQSRSPATAEQLNTALLNRYARDDNAEPTLDTDGAVELISTLPEDSLIEHGTLMAACVAQAPDTVFAHREQAIVESIDDCLKMIFAIMTLDPSIDTKVRRTIPKLAAALVRTPNLPLTGEPSILTVLDHLTDGLTGWSEELGKAGEKLIEQLDHAIAEILASDDVSELESMLRESYDKELARITKLEDRLSASETGRLRSQQSRVLAAEMINKAMAHKQLTTSIVSFLEGPWFDTAQLVVLTQGLESEDWSRMKALTETLIWTYQPIEGGDSQKDKQRLYRIVEHLPGEIRDLLQSLQHETGTAEAALDEIEQDHVMLVSEQQLDYEDFDAIKTDVEDAARPTVSRILLRKLSAFEPGQWFSFEADGKETRIKLLLKLDDVKLMLFTNRNGMKVMQSSFEEFAYLLSAGAAKPLSTGAVFTTTFRTFYEGLVEEYAKQQKRIAERRAEMERDMEAREAARQKALREAEELARQQEEEAREAQKRARAERLDAAKEALADAEPELVDAVTDKVADLAVGAWLKLPGPLGVLEDCKLAVKISATDKMIFVSESGTKIGEYTSEELIRLLVAGQGEIQDEGVEFEDTLQQVVSRLRQDKGKSYDDLTGE